MTDLRAMLQSTFGDAYTIERELGGGGMSRVFVATERALGRQVVVKVLPADIGGVVSAERFRREIAVVARLQHPHIVPLLAAGEAGSLPWFTMPYVKGESLRTVLAAGELPVSDAIRVLREIASALAFAHEAGIVHRDIKPENVLISGGAAMVTDFGVAKALTASTDGDGTRTTTGVAIGTPAYMAPEQASADPNVDHRADIYAWGIVAYELLTGSSPFAGRPASAVLAAQATELPEQITRRRAALPPALSQLVMRCLEKRPADRPQRASELVQTLDAITNPGGRSAATFQPQRHGPVLLIAVAVIAVVGTLLAWPKSVRTAESIAVAPIVTRDTALEFLADGLTDEIHTQLTQIGNLTVRGQQTVNAALMGKALSVREAGTALAVSHLVQGTMALAAGRARLAIDVVRASDGASLWSHTYETDANSFYAIRDSVAQAVARALALKLGRAEQRHRTTDPAALELILRGRFASSKSSESDYHQALRLFEEALRRDSLSAEAYAGIAWTHTFLADGYVNPRTAYTDAERAAEKALNLDSTNADAHLALAMTRIFRDWNFDAAEREFRKAIAINPQRAEAYSTYAIALAWSGRPAEAVRQSERAVAIDPSSLIALFQNAWCYDMAGQYEKALAAFRRARDLEPRFFYLWSMDSWAYRALGKLDSAYAMAQRDLSNPDGAPVIDLALVLAKMGRRAEAEGPIHSAEAKFRAAYYPPELIALAYAAVGDNDKAFEWLEQVFTTRSGFWMQLPANPEWKPLMRDPRWAAFLKRAEAERH